MMLKWLIFSLIFPFITGTGKCPEECLCDTDYKGRLQAICTKGGMKFIPFKDFDTEVEIIIIRGPKNFLTMGRMSEVFSKLEILRITDSNIPAIGKYTFWGVKTLRILDLSKNNITTVTDDNFRGQNDLLELDLSKNKIDRMPSGTFYHLRELRKLNLADNNIEELVQRLFYMLGKLKYLDLGGNPLRDLPPDVFSDVHDLRVLKCRNCQLKKINPQLYNLLPYLIELDLGENQFKFLDKDEFADLMRMTTLRLDGNQLSVVVDGLFRSQINLQFLDLSHNRLAKVPNRAFENLSNLTYLDLSYNKLVELEPKAIRHLKSLQILNISGNVQMDLHEIRSTFEEIPYLSSLAVADMGTLPIGLLVPFRHLRFLNISGNHLNNMTLQIITPSRSLDFLDLSRNQLYGIADTTAIRMKEIRNVRLDNNPLVCDMCHMGTLIELVRHLQWDVYPVCFLPKSLRGAEISDLDSEGLETCIEYISDEEQDAASTSHNFLDEGNFNTLAFMAGFVIVLVVVIIISMVFCLSRHRARYYTHEEKRASADGSKCLEKSNDGAPAITESEINFKFPIDDRVCTIDEIVLPPPPPPPSKSVPLASLSSITNGGSKE